MTKDFSKAKLDVLKEIIREAEAYLNSSTPRECSSAPPRTGSVVA
jgi:hypothetical protein